MKSASQEHLRSAGTPVPDANAMTPNRNRVTFTVSLEGGTPQIRTRNPSPKEAVGAEALSQDGGR